MFRAQKDQGKDKVQNGSPVTQSKEGSESYRKKAIEAINRQKFQRDWTVKQRGQALKNYQFNIISQDLCKTMNKAKDLVVASRELSQLLGAELGYDYWNVIIVTGPFSRKTYASGGFYAVFERYDGLQAIIWLNKLNHQNTMQKSIVKQSEYF